LYVLPFEVLTCPEAAHAIPEGHQGSWSIHPVPVPLQRCLATERMRSDYLTFEH